MIFKRPFNAPISEADSAPILISFATGLPCFVMIKPSGPTLSRIARHCAMNLAAAICFMVAIYG